MAQNKDLTAGDPTAVLWKFCLPMFGSVVFQQLYNLADSFVAGKFIGENALAAVGNSYEITLIFLAFGFGCNIGTSVVSSRLFGGRHYRDLKTAVSTSLIAAGVLCAVLMLFGLIGCGHLLRLIHTPEHIFADSAGYLTVYTLSLPFIFYYNISTGIFTALGDSKTPFIFLACSSTANVAADLIFVTVLHLGVTGTAWATLLCQGVSCLLSLYFLRRRLKSVYDGYAEKFSFRLLSDIAAIAVPSICQQSFISIGNIILQGVINSFGAGVMAGYAAAVKLNNLFITSLTTMGNGVSNFTAQNLGAGRHERIPQGWRASLRLAAGLTVPIMVLYFAGAPMLLRVFMSEPSADAMENGVQFLRIVAPFYLIAALKLMSDGVLRGRGLMGQFMAATFTDLILRVVLAIVMAGMLGSKGIWMAWPIGWTIAALMSVHFYRASIQQQTDHETIAQ